MVATGTGASVYDELSDADRQWLRGAASELRAKLRRTVAEVVAGGRLLADARRRLGRTRWPEWLAREAQIPARSAQRLVSVGTAFGTLSDSTVLNFTPTALYTLAEQGVPQAVREYAVAQARDGEEVTAARVQEWLAGVRRSEPDLSRAELDELAPEDEGPGDDLVDPADVFAKENWVALRDLIGTSGTVHLCGLPDSENDDTAFNGVYIGEGDKRVQATGGTLEAVVLQLTGGVRKKVCARCGVNKPLDEYCRRSDMPDGREYRCKLCERERVKGYARRKAAERGAAA